MSADSLSSPPPLTRYFDLLPLELIRHIIEQLAPSEYNQRMYGERKKSLYSTCLVSRLFQKLAQPLLFEIIEINKDEEMDIFNSLVYKDVGKRLLSITRILVPWDVDDVFGRSHGSDWTAALVRLEHLQVLDGTLTTINMSHLNSLHLSHVNLQCDFELRLPHLKFLSLACTNMSIAPLSASDLPSLRHFAFFDRVHHYTDAEFATFSSLTPQITSMTFVLNLFAALLPLALGTSTGSFLFDCHLGDSEYFDAYATQLSFLRIYQCDTFGPYSGHGRAVKEMWESWTAIFAPRSFQTSLQVLYLDNPSTFSTGGEMAEIHLAMEGLVDVCRRRNIEVVYEEQNTSEVESQISRDFVRRSEARRKAKNMARTDGRSEEA